MSKIADAIRAQIETDPDFYGQIDEGLEFAAKVASEIEAKSGDLSKELADMLARVLYGKWTTAEVENLIKKARGIK